ncbi:hypothetical protein K5549_020487, partial [Capra hircus]
IMNLLQVVHDHWVHILVPVEFVFGCYVDKNNDNRSLLYKKTLKPNEGVTRKQRLWLNHKMFTVFKLLEK